MVEGIKGKKCLLQYKQNLKEAVWVMIMGETGWVGGRTPQKAQIGAV